MTLASTTQAEIMERFLAAADAKDAAGMAELAHPDIVMEWPQSGERFVGRNNALAAYLATEEKPDIAGEPIMAGQGDLWIVRMPLRYGTDIYSYVGVFELEDGLVRRTTEYFAAPFPASDARAPYAEPSPEVR
jgi:hypothetical protein